MQNEYKQTFKRTTNELESDDTALPPTKAVSLYGWDSVGLAKVLIACDDTGAVKITGGGGGSMVYPGVGIALSTGSAWDTSITNNSANWNTAYGWGNHAIAGYLTSVTAHNLLSTIHGDTTADSVVRGDIITGQGATPKWARLAFPATPTGKVLQATATDVVWSSSALGTAAFTASTAYANTALSNLASVAINTSLVSDTNATDDLGTTGIRWKDGWFSGKLTATILDMEIFDGATSRGTINGVYNGSGSLGEVLRIVNFGSLSGTGSIVNLGTEYQAARLTRGSMGLDLCEGTYDINAWGAQGINNAGNYVQGSSYVGTTDTGSGIVTDIQIHGGIVSGVTKSTAGITDQYDSTAGGYVAFTAGLVTSFADDPSDIKFKQDILPLSLDTSKFSRLNPSQWSWNTIKSGSGYGLVAQELETVYPEFVKMGKRSWTEKGITQSDTYKTIDYVGVTSLMIKKIQELESRIEVLEPK